MDFFCGYPAKSPPPYSNPPHSPPRRPPFQIPNPVSNSFELKTYCFMVYPEPILPYAHPNYREHLVRCLSHHFNFLRNRYLSFPNYHLPAPLDLLEGLYRYSVAAASPSAPPPVRPPLRHRLFQVTKCQCRHHHHHHPTSHYSLHFQPQGSQL